MLRIVMLLIGVTVMAPIAIAAFFMALPVLPFVAAGLLLAKLLRARSVRLWPRPIGMADYAPINMAEPATTSVGRVFLVAGAALAVVMIAQIKIWGYSWHVEIGLLLATVLLAGLWWINRRLDERTTSRGGGSNGVARHDIYRLLEIERAGGAEERRVLILRELNRLTQFALRTDPALPSTWPGVPELRGVRDQVRLLRSSALDPASQRPRDSADAGRPTVSTLVASIDVLEGYVNLLLRARLLGRGNLELLRVLVRDQNRLRAMQDEFVGQLQNLAPVPVGG